MITTFKERPPALRTAALEEREPSSLEAEGRSSSPDGFRDDPQMQCSSSE